MASFDLGSLLLPLIPSWSSVGMLVGFFLYLAITGSLLPGKVVPGAVLSDGTRLHYRCNGLASLLVLITLLGVGATMKLISLGVIFLTLEAVEFFLLTFGCKYILCLIQLLSQRAATSLFCEWLQVVADKGIELLSVTFIFSILMSTGLYLNGCRSRDQGSSLKPHITGKFINDWWFGIQLNPQFMGVDLKFFFVRAGMMGWLLINLAILMKSIEDGSLHRSMILYQLFCGWYILDFFIYEEYMTSTWDIIAERLGFMLVFGDLVWIPFTFSIQGWWLLANKVELPKAAVAANFLVFLMGYAVFRGANKQKHVFKKNPRAPLWGVPPKVIGGKLLASGYWGIARHCNYLGDILLALSFSLPCGVSSMIPYFYPTYLLILLIWRERRDEARCAQKYKDIWSEYCKVVPWRILPYVY